MIEAMLRRFGVPQNAERLKAELGREVKGQLSYGVGAVRAGLRASVFYAIAGVFGLITVVSFTLLLYAWLARHIGDLGALAVIAIAFGVMTFIATVMAKTRISEVPKYQAFTVPQLYKKVEHPQKEEQPVKAPVTRATDFANTSTSPRSSIGAEGETRQWVLGLVKQGYSRHLNTGVTEVDSFIDTMRPDAELMAGHGLKTIEEQLREGSRPTIAGILLGGLITGFMLSRRGVVKLR